MTQLAISQDDYLARESPKIVYEGAEPVWTMRAEGVSNIANDGTLAMYVSRAGVDKTSDFTTGSMSASGNIVTLKKLHNLKGGDELFITVQGTVDGVLDTVGTCWVYVKRRSGK